MSSLCPGMLFSTSRFQLQRFLNSFVDMFPIYLTITSTINPFFCMALDFFSAF
jgi:hypothetical protein